MGWAHLKHYQSFRDPEIKEATKKTIKTAALAETNSVILKEHTATLNKLVAAANNPAAMRLGKVEKNGLKDMFSGLFTDWRLLAGVAATGVVFFFIYRSDFE